MPDNVRVGGLSSAPIPVESLHFRLDADHADEFATEIRDAAIGLLRNKERFSAIRLNTVKLSVNQFMHGSFVGKAYHALNKIEVKLIDEANNGLGLAATILHKCAHIIVGPEQDHNENWRDACHALGLLRAEPNAADKTLPEHFDAKTFALICEALLRFAAKHPELVYDPDQPIPWPADIGLWSCPEPHDSYHRCSIHRAHVLEYQDKGIREMLARKRGILLADEMGLGKTVQAMGYINATHPEKILVVCPNNAKLVWKRHLESWCVHSYELEVAHPRLFLFSDVVICSYETAIRLSDVLKRTQWDLIVYDEGHYLKNPSAKRSKACYSFHAKKKMIVTGSPIVNYVLEIFPLAHYLDRENYREAAAFEARFGGRGNAKFGYNLGQLNSLLRNTIMTRRFKKDVLPQLPQKRRQIIEFEVDDEIKPLIESEKRLWADATADVTAEQAQFLAAMKNESDVTISDDDWADLILALQNKRRYAFEEMARIAHQIALAKLPLVFEHIENAIESRDKVVVFGHHRDVLEAVKAKFPELNPVLLYGGQGEDENMRFAERFSTDENCKLLIAGVKIAQSWSLQQSSTVLFIEEDWVPGVMTQAEDRVHGIGRGATGARSTLIQHLVFEDSLDTYKAQLTIKKQKSIDRATGK